ncbi:MAG: TatD family hydrolase [Alphaproteobacteria bacterium]|nr:TatD family hydrolase [Alphaproteobacteria bacterium]
MFIDTHCHLTDEYDGGVDALIARANAAGVNALICATAEGTDIKPALQIANTHDNIFVTCGIHPDHTDLNPYDFLTDNILNHPKVIGVGEIGLDYHYSPETRNAQIELFETQLDIAHKHNLPVAIHTRDADEDTAAILSNKTTGVMHCFTSGWDLAKTMLDRGFYFSASGILTFKNAESIRETFAKIPMDRIVIETDSPYCAPVPHRGKVCEPAFVIETAKVLAQIKKLQIEELEKILFENTKRLYPKISVANG